MKLFGYDISFSRKAQTMTLDTLIQRISAVYETAAGIAVTPDTAMQSPTVLAIVTAVSRRIASLPVKVYKKEMVGKRVRRVEQPDHPVTRLLSNPNNFSDRVTFWLDATSWLVRFGNYYAFKARGQTGPVRELIPLCPGHVNVDQDLETLDPIYRATMHNGAYREFGPRQLLHARGPARDGFNGDSPIMDIREAIALDIAAEKMGSSLFGNSATPGMVLNYAPEHPGYNTEEEEQKFLRELENVYARKGRHRALLLPKGIELGQQLPIDNEKAQFIGTRQYQRTVIAGAFGIPPHLVGDLSRGTFNNVEQQNLDFSLNVILPYARIFEASMERSLLSDEDRRRGIVIRFNLDAGLRVDFKARMEGMKIKREMGVINPNDWREEENQNPISAEDGGETYWKQGPSGQNQAPAPTDDNSNIDPGNPEPNSDDIRDET